MPPLYRVTSYALSHLVEDIKVGRIGLPDIQRPFVWSSAKARDLLDSMYRGYPIGTLMFWETGAEVGTRQIGTEENDRTPQLLVVDGQQRLTSLFAVITGRQVLTKSFDEKRIRIAFRPEDERFEVADAATDRDPEFIPDITALWTAGYNTARRGFLRRLTDAGGAELDSDRQDELEERIDRVRDLREFPFQVVELQSSAQEDEVAEIFVRINSEGVQLKQADFILTLMSVHWEKGRRELEAFSRAAVDPRATGPGPRNPFLEPGPDQLLRVGVALAFRRARLQHVYSILGGKNFETGHVSAELRNSQFALLAAAQERVLDLTNWHEFLKCLRAAGFRSHKMITSDNAVLYSYALWLIGRRDFGLDLPTLRTLIARWFFMAHTTGRYTSSPESQLEFDLGRLADLPSSDPKSFVGELDRAISAQFTRDYWEISMPNRLDTSSSRSPVLFAYYAALNLLDAEALFSDVRIRDLLDPETMPPRSIEWHHLFPRNYLASLGAQGTKQVNAIGNMAFLDRSENAAIRDSSPAEYVPAMTARMDARRYEQQRRWHALPVGWEQLDYATFVEKRRTLIAQVVRDGFAAIGGTRRPDQDTIIEDLIRSGESRSLEFKSTARWNVRAGRQDPVMEHVIVKTVCGLLNSEGGVLLIGVGDDGTVLGIEPDLATLGSRQNVDGYELFLRQLLENSLSAATAQTVQIRFHDMGGRQVCEVAVAASGRPVFAKSTRGSGSEASEFWVRVGNSTRQLHGDDMVQYQEEHWA